MTVFHQEDEAHVHQEPAYNTSFLIAILANGLFVISQIIFAYVANSTSLFADAIHNFGDVLSLILAWIAQRLLQHLPTERSTYGMKKTSILAALANGILLVFSCGIIATEAVYKLLSPATVHASAVMVIAGIGIVINGVTALLFMHGKADLNIRAAFLHLMYDALISLGVVFSAAILYWTGWLWIDPLVGLLIAIIIIKGTWSLFADSFRLLIDGVPRDIALVEVHHLLRNQAGVKGVHDLHIWALSTKENALSVHLWMPDMELTDMARQELSFRLKKEHNIHHATFQVERIQGYCEATC